ncbi:hypothetical protein GW17_00045613, partial [Ensete ventricosum]
MEVWQILVSCPLMFLYSDGLKRIRSSLLDWEAMGNSGKRQGSNDAADGNDKEMEG